MICVQPRFFSPVTSTLSPGARTARTGDVSSALAKTSTASVSMTYMWPLTSLSAAASFGSGARSALRLTLLSPCRAAVMRSPRSPAEAWLTAGLAPWLSTTAVETPTSVSSPAAGSASRAKWRRRCAEWVEWPEWACERAWVWP
jgi:hypothetical protein